MKKTNPISLPRLIFHILMLLPGVIIALDWVTNRLTINPIQRATQLTGDTAIVLLGLSLACTPLQVLTGWKKVTTYRRPLGLYAFAYAATHFLIFSGVDYTFDLPLLVDEIVHKRYLWVSIPALIILIILAITSTKTATRSLGKRWKPLHRLVYIAGILVALHLAWVVKGDLLRLTGDIWKPLIAVIVLSILFLIRIPRFRRWIVSIRHTIARGEQHAREPNPGR